MKSKYYAKIAAELEIEEWRVRAAAELLADGATVPFIARYRKEITGILDETAITSIRNRLAQLEELDKRRHTILKSLEERGLLTDELQAKIESAEKMAVLEDIYLPFRPKRRTRAAIARERGLEPLAKLIFDQDPSIDPAGEAKSFVNKEKEVLTIEDALAGARDIIAEWINENDQARADMRRLFTEKAVFFSKVVEGKESAGAKYRDYFNWSELMADAPSHRILAMRRGEKEGILSLKLFPPEEEALKLLETQFIKDTCSASEQVQTALVDSYKRLLAPAMETEMRVASKRRADQEAIAIFAQNLRELLLSPLLGEKNVLAIDPGFRTGCKVACLDRQGNLQHQETIFPHSGEKSASEAAERIKTLAAEFEVEAFAIGNGTAGRETERFIRQLNLPGEIPVILVNESGASVYSASKIAREEFPDQDVTVRGTISIGRRLMDPLAEMVKIDPKSIGVGQYQHDVDQKALRESLVDVVVSCVNAVGVELNTASPALLTYVSGIGSKAAVNIVAFRNEYGPFRVINDLQAVAGIGPKAFEQAAGFLRIRGGENPLDASAVHPESYHIVEAMAGDLNCNVITLMNDEKIREKIQLKHYVTDTVGLPTLNDIIEELAKPGRDPREQLEIFTFAEGIEKIEDLRQGMKLPGIVTNVTAFGAFIDIGVHQDGLVHISQLADRFVKNPADVVKVNQKVMVTVMQIDLERRRIALSMRKKQ